MSQGAQAAAAPRRRRLLRAAAAPLWFLTSRMSREGKLLATLLCASAVLGTNVDRSEAHVLLAAAGALLASSLLFSRAYALRGVRVEARYPRRVAVGEVLELSILLRNEGDERHGAVRVEGPRLPYDASWVGDPPELAQLAPGERAEASLRVRFGRRGARRLGPAQAAALVPWGLAQGAPLPTEPVRVVVVPRPARVVRLSTPTNRRHQPGGIAQASRVGDASEMLGVRPYRPGDPARDLHARSWARVGYPVVREYQQEYFTRVGVVLDTDAFAGPKHLEAALSLTAGVVAHLCNGETLVDLLVAGDEVHRLSLGRGLGTLDQALDVLAGVQAGKRLSADAVLARVGPHLERLSSLVIVALAWDDARAALADAVRGRGVGCAVLVVGPEASLPAGARAVPLDAIARGEALSL